MRFRLVEDALKLLAQHGIAGEVEQGRHLKIKFQNEFGRKCLLVVSVTPGNRRARKQNRSQLRRLLLRRPAP
jgi:hypothetical protein